MGFNLEGFATNASEEQILTALEIETKRLHPKSSLQLEKEISFEEWMTRKAEDNVLDIYSTSEGSLISASHKFMFNFIHRPFSKNFDLYKFDLSETTMQFRFEICKNGELFQVMIIDDSQSRKLICDQILPVQDEDVFMDLFPRYLKMITRFDFHMIDLSKRGKRFVFANFDREEYYFV
jgi:hypothetical protein